MNWYVAKMVFHIVCGEGDHKPQFDEQYRLINAKTKIEALQKARKKGELENDTFMNNSMNVVKWQFVDVGDLFEIAEPKDGVEFFSRIEEQDNAKEYINLIRQKAQDIEMREVLFF